MATQIITKEDLQEFKIDLLNEIKKIMQSGETTSSKKWLKSKEVTNFFSKVASDKTLNPSHVSLYMSLLQFWNCNQFRNPISINREEVMQISKITSKTTYHKCLKNLHSLGYIKYEPSYNPFKGSYVYILCELDKKKSK